VLEKVRNGGRVTDTRHIIIDITVASIYVYIFSDPRPKTGGGRVTTTRISTHADGRTTWAFKSFRMSTTPVALHSAKTIQFDRGYPAIIL